ncbi:hypothetical protein O4H49_14365 [Kiloniella laminariae]|uniref:Right handed beta helix domain-containing protein n=1 Tax=Kiloniella laminariae TaxID=454162 RepID=A0ABT4LLL2_9PROT|nr:hypothetical protein [Kiloniella laminariae]MCZ4281972.1 hypothetical protein [Kiloniella laminariae]
MIKKRKLNRLFVLSGFSAVLIFTAIVSRGFSAPVSGATMLEAIRNYGILSYLKIIKQPLWVGNLSNSSGYFANLSPEIFNDRNGVLEIKPGVHLLDYPVNLGGPLMISPGTTVRFSPDSYLLVKGAVTAVGTPDAPIVLQGQKGQLWKGIYVYNADSLSELDNVVIADTTAFADGYLTLTGAVTFYQSALKVTNTAFKNSEAEDGLNIINSGFSLTNTRFENMRSDALDSDFSHGNIIVSEFDTIGGDAIDLSGTKSRIENPRITGVRDKAISAGENSTVNVIGGFVKSVGVAAASKDGSVVKIRDTRIEDVTLFGLMTYIKKSSYNFPSLIAYNLFWGAGTSGRIEDNWIRQTGTVLTIDGQSASEQDIDVKALYKGAVMSK